MSNHRNLRSLGIVVMMFSLFAVAGCHRDSGSAAAESVLTDAKLVDQNGNTVALTSLKGKPMVVDFIYTSCPGPCLMETAKLENVALRLGSMTARSNCSTTRVSKARIRRDGIF